MFRAAAALITFTLLAPRTVAAQDSLRADVALATFDSAWSRVRAYHYDTTFGGLDWDAVRSELRPRVQRTPREAEVRRTIRDMIARLGVSHYALIPREVSEALDPAKRAGGAQAVPADAGVQLRVSGKRLVVWRVQPDGPAAQAGVRPGSVVRRVGEYDTERALGDVRSLSDARERQLALTRFLYAANRQLEGEVGDTVRLRLEHDTHLLTLRPTPGRVVRFGNVPAAVARVTQQRLPAGQGCIGVIALNNWFAPMAAEIDAAVDALRDCRGMVLDLRGNPGGVAGMVMGVGGHFVDSTRALGTMKMRNNELRFVLNPRRVNARGENVRVFAGPLAILVDPMSASTSEIFAAGMQAIGRARVFGELTAGQALPALAARLPNGDVLMHAVADYLVVDGSRVEGRGVVPDVTVELNAAALRAGRDPVLEAARSWILQSN